MPGFANYHPTKYSTAYTGFPVAMKAPWRTSYGLRPSEFLPEFARGRTP